MNQLQPLHFGFHNLTRAVSTGSVRVVMGSKRFAKDHLETKGKRLNALVGCSSSPDHETPILKESVFENCSVEIESFKDDPGRIEKMTVQDLRTTLRSIGVPVKGRKSDLVSSLKSFVEKNIIGQSSQISGEQLLSISAKSESVEIEGKQLHEDDDKVHNVNAVSEIDELKRSKRTVKQSQGVKISRIETNISSETLESAPWTILAHKKPEKHWIPYNPRTMRPPPLSRDTKSVKLMSWNVNGLRALLKLEGFSAPELAQREDFDVLCLQETKLQEKDVENIAFTIDGYRDNFWTCSVAKLGYSGTAIISRVKPLSVTYGLGISDHDSEGRLVTAEFDSFFLICVYVPNSGDGLKRLIYRTTQWDPSLSSYIKELEKSKPVILTGDLNCAHQEIDIFNPAGNKKSAGFTIEERQSFEKNFLSNGLVDTFRRQHPGVVGYTYWGYRHGGRKTNQGWRLDYFLASESIADRVHDSYIVPDIHGSDHCPIGLVLKF